LFFNHLIFSSIKTPFTAHLLKKNTQENLQGRDYSFVEDHLTSKLTHPLDINVKTSLKMENNMNYKKT